MRNVIFYALIVASFMVGLSLGKGTHKNPSVIINNKIEERTLSEWQVMKLAIAKTESEFNPSAVGKTDDWGILQITPIYVKEVNRILGEERYTHEDAFDPEKSMDMFTVMQNHYNPKSDVDRAIRSHNPTASNAYSVKVRKNMEFIRRYEELRKLAK